MLMRSQFGWSAFNGERSNTDKGLVVHYDGADQNLANKVHDKCIAYWVRTFAAHKAKGWNGIGYSYGVCPHGEIFEGRGYGFVQAAQKSGKGKLPDGNERWVSCTFMSGPGEVPTDKQITAFRTLRTHVMRKGNKGVVKVHGDFTATDCPGTVLTKLARSGKLIKDDETEELIKTLPIVDHNGAVTESAVKAVQKAAGIDDDGIIGNDTWGVLLRKVVKK